VKQQKTLLRHLRREREISLDYLRFKTGINVSTISRMERRLITGTPEQRKSLAKFFKVSEDALLQDAPVSATEAA
jgi:transcriptional regulator with XRE-family HTH domain